MKHTIDIFPYRCLLTDPFGIARDVSTHRDILIIQVDGGWGEAAPNAFYGEFPDTATAALRAIEQLDLPDLDYIDDVQAVIEANIRGEGAAKAAFNMALYDRLGKKYGMPLHKLWGKSPRKTMLTSFTIGIDTLDVMMNKVEKSKQYDILKIKIGKDPGHDVAVMREIRKACPDTIIRVDMNAGYNLDQAIEVSKALADLGVEYAEQPLAKKDFENLAKLKKVSPLPILVDEDSMTMADLPKLVGLVDGINIKLMKSGGITEALRMIALAQAYDYRLMIGCMVETSLAVTAASHLAAYCEYIDLDGSLLTCNDPFIGATFTPNGIMTVPETPGIGAQLRPEYAQHFSR